MISFGADPDLHDTAIAAWDDTGPVGALMIHVPRRKGVVGGQAVLEMVQAIVAHPSPHLAFGVPNRVAVEAQELARGPGGQHRRPQDIVTLGQVAGALLCQFSFLLGKGGLLMFPKPSEWKGSVPKTAMQARLYDALGWGYTRHGTGSAGYASPNAVPSEFSHLRQTDWRHAGDALLLAKWAHEYEQATQKD